MNVYMYELYDGVTDSVWEFASLFETRKGISIKKNQVRAWSIVSSITPVLFYSLVLCVINNNHFRLINASCRFSFSFSVFNFLTKHALSCFLITSNTTENVYSTMATQALESFFLCLFLFLRPAMRKSIHLNRK